MESYKLFAFIFKMEVHFITSPNGIKDQKDGCVNAQLPESSKKPTNPYLNHP